MLNCVSHVLCAFHASQALREYGPEFDVAYRYNAMPEPHIHINTYLLGSDVIVLESSWNDLFQSDFFQSLFRAFEYFRH